MLTNSRVAAYHLEVLIAINIEKEQHIVNLKLISSGNLFQLV